MNFLENSYISLHNSFHPLNAWNRNVWNRHSGSFMSIRRSYSAIWSIPLTNVKWHSDPWPTVTSQPIRLSTNFMTFIPSLTFTDYEWFPWSICNGCGMPAGNAYPSGHLVPSPIVGLACAPIVETRFLELAMSLLDFSPRIPLGTFSILLLHTASFNLSKIKFFHIYQTFI